MLRRQVSVLLGFLLLAGGLGYGIVELFKLRMTHGDVFPPYSTLRGDPLGTKVLLDSLNAIPGLNALRNYRPLVRLKPTGPITLVYAGIRYESYWEDKELSHFDELVSSGSRAVFAFAPERARTPAEERSRRERKEEAKKAEEEEKKKKEQPGKKETPEEKKRRLRAVLLEKKGTAFEEVAAKWGFKFQIPHRVREEHPPELDVTAEKAGAALERSLPWNSELYFEDLKPEWKTLYSMNGRPVVIERTWGAGSIVLAADSYFLSNEGLFGKRRPPKLLAHLIGSPRTIVFDEEHLGVTEQSGISTLARKYQLHGLIGGLALIAALFLWQNMVRFVPPQPQALEAASLVAGRGSSEGFLALLRRSVPASDLLSTCLAEWRRAFANDARILERVNAVAPAQPPRKSAEIVAVYSALAQAVISNQKAVISPPTPRPQPPKSLATAAV